MMINTQSAYVSNANMTVFAVLTQALLQTQNPDIQAKLLAMQKQFQVGDAVDDEGSMSPPLLPVRTPTMLAHAKLAAQHKMFAFDIRGKLTSEQKEEQTR